MAAMKKSIVVEVMRGPGRRRQTLQENARYGNAQKRNPRFGFRERQPFARAGARVIEDA
jgi:hypothetical protein